jgi:caffeoyl-CoA O-methyltransferase
MDLIDPRIEEYVLAHTTPAPDHLQRLEADTRASLALPQMFSGTVVGRLLESLVFLRKPQLVLEIGTYSGGSALWMAQALPPGGRIVTCEVVEENAAFAQRHIDETPFADRIEIRLGPALETIAALDGPYDFVFIDADKTGYPDYYEAVLPKLAPDGLIVADNTLRDGTVLDPQAGDDGARAIAAFNDRVAADPRVVTVQLTVRDGLTLIRPA